MSARHGPDDPDGTPKFRNLQRQHGKSNALTGSSGHHRHDAAVLSRYEKGREFAPPTRRPIPSFFESVLLDARSYAGWSSFEQCVVNERWNTEMGNAHQPRY